MNRFVVMVDAGYLLRQSIEIVSKKASTLRADLEISDPTALIKVLVDKSKATLDLSGKELLRVYWYDGVMAQGYTPQQRAIVNVDDVQFRAGTINGRGQQKGVDSLIVTDLIELTSHRAVCDAVLVTGDSDLAVGIEIAQRRGVRIAVLGVEDLALGVSHHQSFEITSRADRVGMLGDADFAPCLKFSPAKPSGPNAPASAPNAVPGVRSQTLPPATATPIDKAAIEAAVKGFIGQQASPLTGAVDPVTKRIDATIDRALVHHVYTALAHGQLSGEEKVYARQIFRSQV
ncbi:NYN domain-containing protein [Schlegelella sp. S2-27]|uniref:NYN domain-containing protein n=1 Tax=Caldimonas mangrovi TaxID=2944811 RepID=A0ABT0YUZ7_9BURK|nr:NYN domain-containing protein [Caldimonas mangrovi]MCM5682112.1 NYN domain-containing protein [Caldimonas mangrovi]